ncbi:MAG TPA: polyprenyl synthetase family protein [Tenuifilaceae bacterium]|nr:polyprenyl synthetase family protein [Tenuifilaceae bacterium]
MFTADQLSAIFSELLQGYSFEKEPRKLYEPIRYVLSLGGKRIRPILTLAACNMFSDDIEPAKIPALAIEVFHNFTLIHDDIMDNATIRRGKETVHEHWDTNVAILSGDAMSILAYKLLTQTHLEYLQQVMNIFNSSALGVCEGQQLDMDFESREMISRDEYIKMIELKTAVLLKCALQIGATLGNATTRQVELVGQLGTYLGLSFQLQDDLLDAFGEVGAFGKAIGGDIVAGKNTILPVETTALISPEEAGKFIKILKANNLKESDKISMIMDYYNRVDVKAVVEELIAQYQTKAAEIFEKLDIDNNRKTTMHTIMDSLVGRKK